MTTSHIIVLALALARYIPRAIIQAFAILAATIAAPVVCCFPIYADETAMTGYTSQFPNKPRAFLPPWCRWMQSHDDCLDAYWYSGRAAWMGFGQAYYDTHAWLRWACAVLWVWRNPAYGSAYWLGFDTRDVWIEQVRDEEETTWDSGLPSLTLRLAENGRGEHAFLLMWQWYFAGDRCVEVLLGWKIPADDDVNRRAMLGLRISPFKRYPL